MFNHSSKKDMQEEKNQRDHYDFYQESAEEMCYNMSNNNDISFK